MKTVILLLAIVALSAAHLCIFNPPARGTPVPNQTEYDNNLGGTASVCKQNVNVAPFDNLDSSTYGTVCGGNLEVENGNLGVSRTESVWNSVGAATNLGTAGQDTYTIEILRNAGHFSASGVRGAFILIDIALDNSDAATNDKFIPIAIIPSSGQAQLSYDWEIPEGAQTTGGILRATYIVGQDTLSGNQDPGLGPTPFSNTSLGTIAGYYTQCADVIIDAPVVDGGDRAARYTYF